MTTTLRPAAPPELGSGGDGSLAEPSRSQSYAVCSNGRPIGSVRLNQRGVRGWVSDLEVAPERRRRGHGSIAVLTAEEVLREWGCRRVMMAVPANADAPAVRGFAEALGYVVDRQRMLKRLWWRRPRMPHGVRSRRLRPEEYAGWLAEEIAEYAGSLVAHGDMTRAEAEARAPETYAALFPQELRTPGLAVRALQVADARVGTVLVAFTPRDAPRQGWVYHVQVDPQYRGRGYGRALMLVAERECRARGVGQLGLNVFTANHVAMGLYTSLGYRVDTWVLTKTI